MANILNNTNIKNGSERDVLESKYKNSISNLILIIAFSVINVVLLVTNSDTYFLFSAFIPYCLADYGMYFCGMYPEEYYYDMQDMEFADKSLFAVALAIAVAILLIYLLCWFLAKKKKIAGPIAALVMFVIDTVAMVVVAGISTDLIIDYVFHAWIIFSLANSIIIYNKLKKLPEEEIESEWAEEDSEQNDYPHLQGNSGILRMADNEVKVRILLEAEAPGYHIVYRRVKKTNELVVNGRVYDEYEALVEMPHSLIAVIDGHKIEVQYDASSHMYILFDGEKLAKKLRIV